VFTNKNLTIEPIGGSRIQSIDKKTL